MTNQQFLSQLHRTARSQARATRRALLPARFATLGAFVFNHPLLSLLATSALLALLTITLITHL